MFIAQPHFSDLYAQGECYTLQVCIKNKKERFPSPSLLSLLKNLLNK